MGTQCHITIAGKMSKRELSILQEKIDAALDDVNRQMSAWDPDSELSRFNRQRSTQPFTVSPEFAGVVERALFFAAETGGAFDPTVKPLVDFWGFGAAENKTPVDEILETVGWQNIESRRDAPVASGARKERDGGVASTLRKLHPGVQLDLGAIAKGYGVDCVAEIISAAGIKNFLVEIGGEIRATGKNRAGKLWAVGIETPVPGKPFGAEIHRTLRISGAALATSGSYRQFRTDAAGTPYSHIIDPRTGAPAQSGIVSVTVIAERCMDADAAATALLVMGPDAALQWLESHPEFAAHFILHAGGATFTTKQTLNFPEME